MSTSSAPARHRAPGRPATALTDVAASTTGSIAVIGRRTAVAAAAAGLVLSTFGAPAGAANGEQVTLGAWLFDPEGREFPVTLEQP